MVRYQVMDSKVLREWAKKELFKRVKFIYNPKKDLMIGGKIYQLFLMDCRKRLLGLETAEARSSKQYREMYVHRLWNDNTKAITKEIANKRTSIYSTYYTRFMGKGSKEKVCLSLIQGSCLTYAVERVMQDVHRWQNGAAIVGSI